jgi:hypothetical protein
MGEQAEMSVDQEVGATVYGSWVREVGGAQSEKNGRVILLTGGEEVTF